MSLNLLEKLCHYAASRPDINCWPILLLNEYNLRWAIPASYHMIRKLSVHSNSLPVFLVEDDLNLSIDLILCEWWLPVDLENCLSLLNFFLNFLSHFERVRFKPNDASSEAEITNFDMAIFID